MEPALSESAARVVARLGTVRSVEPVQRLWRGYGWVLRVVTDQASVIVKQVDLRGAGDGGHGHRRKLRSYEVEEAWYADYAARVPVRLAGCVHASPGLLVLEDLDAAGFSGRTHTPSERQLEHMVTWLAGFHRHHLGIAAVGLWERGTYWHLATRPEELAQMAPGPLREGASELDRRLVQAPVQTLVHGDAKPANFCFGDDGVAAVDFQYVGGGVGVRDLVYLLGCLPERRLRLEHDRWVRRYFDRLGHDEAKACWEPLIPVAWADFERFLAGWAPEHRKRTGFAAEQTRRALAL